MTLSREMNVSSRSNSSFHIRLSNDGSQLNALPEDDLSPERIQQLMAQFDSSSSEAIKNLHLHATHSGLANAGPALRQAGLLPLLVNVLSQSEQSKEGQETDQASIRAMSADVLATITTDDVSSADLLIRLDIVKTLCCKGCIDSHSLGKGMTLTTSSLQLLLVIIRQLTPGSRNHLYDQLFSFGAIVKICSLLDWPAASQVSARIMGWVTGVSQFRERLRDLGQISSLVTSCRNNSQSPFHITCIMNLALSDSLVLCLKDCDVLGVMQEVLSHKDVPEVVATNAVAVVALVYGGQESSPEADQLLTVHNVAESLVAALSCCLAGDGMHGGLVWRLSHVLKIMQSLSSREQQATMLVHVGAIQAILRALKIDPHASSCTHDDSAEGADKVPSREPSVSSSPLPSSPSVGPQLPHLFCKRLDVDLNVTLAGCRTLSNLASYSSLVPLMKDQGVVHAMSLFQGHPDLRVADAAQSCLFQLNQVENGALKKGELGLRAKSNDRMKRLSNLSTGDLATGASPADDSVMAHFGAEEGEEEEDEDEDDLYYDVFLSHKRTDAKDFARALYNLLVLRGLKTFLDYEFRAELNDLSKIVSRCKNLIFVLTDNVLESEWCLKELESAVDNKVNVIFVTKEGSRWKDVHGNKVCDFPPQHLIDQLPDKIKGLMTRKAIAHSDEYYQAFVDTLLKKINLGIQKAINLADGPRSSGGSVVIQDEKKLSPSSSMSHIRPMTRSGSGAHHPNHSPLSHSSKDLPPPSTSPSPFLASSLLPPTSEGGGIARVGSSSLPTNPSLAFGMAASHGVSSGDYQSLPSHPHPHPHLHPHLHHQISAPHLPYSHANSPPHAHFPPHPHHHQQQHPPSSTPSPSFASSIPGLLSSHQASLDQSLGAIQTQIRELASQVNDLHVQIPNDVAKAQRDLGSQIHALTTDLDLVKRDVGEIKSKVQSVESYMSKMQASMDLLVSLIGHQVVPQLAVMQAFQDGLIGPLSSAIIQGGMDRASYSRDSSPSSHQPALRENGGLNGHASYNNAMASVQEEAAPNRQSSAHSSRYELPEQQQQQQELLSSSQASFLPPLAIPPTSPSAAVSLTSNGDHRLRSPSSSHRQHSAGNGSSSVLIAGNIKLAPGQRQSHGSLQSSPLANGIVAGRKGGGWVGPVPGNSTKS